MDGTKAFFAQAAGLHDDNIPDKVATDGLASYPRAIEQEKMLDMKFVPAQKILSSRAIEELSIDITPLWDLESLKLHRDFVRQWMK